MSEFVFKVDYRCHNCGNEWSKRYPEKVRVEYGATRIVLERDKEESRGSPQTTRVSCPVCGLRKEVKIEDRNPIKD